MSRSWDYHIHSQLNPEQGIEHDGVVSLNDRKRYHERTIQEWQQVWEERDRKGQAAIEAGKNREGKRAWES